MAKQVQLRGGTTSQHSSFTGVAREVTVDTDKDTIVVHDGSTAGGVPLAKASELPTLTSLSVTSTAAELNILDGVTATAAELNYTDGVTSAIQTQLDAKQATISSLTSTGAELNVVDMSASGSTSGQVLTSTGTGTVPTWQNSGGTLDSPSITGTLSIDSGGTVSHTVANWSDDITYTITPTNCTVGAVNSSGVFVVTHTSGNPSYTIVATTDSLGLDNSSTVTKNIVMNLSAPTLSSPADVGTATDVVYTITSTDSGDDKIILDIGSSNFTYSSVSVGTASKVGNTVECIGFTTNNPAVTIQFTAEATYSVTAKSTNIAGTYGDSASSSADSITIADWAGVVASGGTVTTDGDYKVHSFTGDGSFVVSSGGTVEYLIVAGGGAGASYLSGGGGAGGYRNGTGFSVVATSYTISVGAGGANGGTAPYGGDGSSSTFSSITSAGGGGGGMEGSYNGRDGGSGGGTGNYSSSGGSGNVPSVSPSQGNNAGGGNTYSGGSGGGGAGSASTVGASTYQGSNGGAGRASSITGSSIYRAGGGGGGCHYGSGTLGGNGGGGRGGAPTSQANHPAGAGATNTGGGGGGGANQGWSPGNGLGADGGSGIVIIRYQYQ